uniref:Uncharacterized protein n=1 Tax=Amphiprion percula TaxID=161767 RepID=A0A3P8SZ00_AMPPE
MFSHPVRQKVTLRLCVMAASPCAMTVHKQHILEPMLCFTVSEVAGGDVVGVAGVVKTPLMVRWVARMQKTTEIAADAGENALIIVAEAAVAFKAPVFAENIAGISEPSLTSDPIKATRAITKPGPPGNLKLKDWSKSYADICWTKPTRDGGSPILGYVVEAQKSGTAQWDRINKDLIKMCAYRVPGLIEGLEYRIRVRATNKVGDSEPRELAETILAKDILVPPEVVVDVSCRDSLTVRAGQIISLITRVKGRPDPEITWSKDARALSRDKRTEINNNYPLCELVINDAVRSDYGKYAIVAKNSSGQAQATIIVNVLDTPGACQNLKVAYVTKNSCMVSWENPEDNGGTEITQYIVECRQPSQRGWTVETYFMADSCIENQIYQFRVQTKNEGGESNWVTTAEVMVKEQLVEPEIKIQLDGTLVVKAGDSIPIEATVKGKPQPDVKWTKDEGTAEIRKGPRLQIETGADFSKLLVTGARRTDSGKYVVTASNSAGTCSAHAKVNIDLDADLKQGLTVRAGCPIRLCATIRGRPPPKVTWRRMGIDNVVRKGKVDIIDTMTFLVIPDSTRDDSGKYCLMLQSPAGEKAVFVNVKVLGESWISLFILL